MSALTVSPRSQAYKTRGTIRNRTWIPNLSVLGISSPMVLRRPVEKSCPTEVITVRSGSEIGFDLR